MRTALAYCSSRVKQLALHLQKLCDTQRGCPVGFLRPAVIQCVIPAALYGADAFDIGQRQNGFIDSLRSPLRFVALVIPPVYTTTPVSALLSAINCIFIVGIQQEEESQDRVGYGFTSSVMTRCTSRPVGKVLLAHRSTEMV